MEREVAFSPGERRVLWCVALLTLFGLNGVFLYGLFFRPAALSAALTNPISLAFVLEALLLMFVVGWLFARWGVSRLGFGWFVLLSLIGGLGFAIPVSLLWGRRVDPGKGH